MPHGRVDGVQDVLDVEEAREVEGEEVEELGFGGGQRGGGGEAQQIGEVVRRVEGDEGDVRVEDEAGGDEQLAELSHIDAIAGVQLKVETRLQQQVDTILRIHIHIQRELEMKLPHITHHTITTTTSNTSHTTTSHLARYQIPILVHQRQPQLYQLEHIDIQLQSTIQILTLTLKITHRTTYHTRKLTIHTYIRIGITQLGQPGQLVAQVVLPDVDDAGWWGWWVGGEGGVVGWWVERWRMFWG